MPEIKSVIWDWNGTLIDDRDVCIHSMNRMLRARNMPQLTVPKYLEVFTFPVIDYYRAIGFDFEKESWERAAIEFIDHYLAALPTCGLMAGVSDVLVFFKGKNLHQAIISAMEHEALTVSVHSLGIGSFFDYIGGIGDHYGGGKIENARNYFRDSHVHPNQVLLIGDTIHDAEVAGELGCNCLLVAGGHQSIERLRATGHRVVQGLRDITGLFNGNGDFTL